MAQIHISKKAWKHLSTMKIEDPKKFPNFEKVLDHELFGEEELEVENQS